MSLDINITQSSTALLHAAVQWRSREPFIVEEQGCCPSVLRSHNIKVNVALRAHRTTAAVKSDECGPTTLELLRIIVSQKRCMADAAQTPRFT